MKINRPYSTNIIDGPNLNVLIAAFGQAFTGDDQAVVEFRASLVRTINDVRETVLEESFTTQIVGLEYTDDSRVNVSIKMRDVVSKSRLVVEQLTFYYNTESRTGFVYSPDTPLDL